MPISLLPVSRRRFLQTSIAAGAAGTLTSRLCAQQTPRDANRFALLSDPHIAADRKQVARGTVMADNLAAVGRELTALQTAPSAVLVNGDCAYLTGQSADYATLVELLEPIRQHGLPIHLAMGNHDHRQRFWEAIPRRDEAPALEQKHLTLLSTPRANWIVLDSLDETNKTPGVLGQEQLAWLAKTLDQQADKPAIVMLHHNPDERPKPGGLVETAALFDVLLPRRQVKMLVFGHTHNWNISARDGLHLVNLPPVAYPFAAGKPNGWVDLQLAEKGALLTLQCLDKQHLQHGQRVELTWRS
jgi:hypothetical protein